MMRKRIKPPQPLFLFLLLGSFLLVAGCGYSTGVYRTVPYYRPYAAPIGYVSYYGCASYPYYRGGYGSPYRYYGGRYASYRRHGHIGHYGYHSHRHQGHSGGHYGYHHGHYSHGH